MTDEMHEATRPRLRLAIFVALAALVPLPFYLIQMGRMPLVYLFELVGLVAAAILAEGLGQMSGLTLWIAASQAALYAVALAVAAWLLDRLVHAFAAAFAGRIVLGAVAAGLFVGLVWPIYVAPFSQISTRTNLAGAYRWPDLEPLPEPPSAVFETPTAVAEREPCAHRTPLRQPLFGDTHVHTALSFDSVGHGTRNRPADAYRFAKGEPVGIQPYDREGRPSMHIALRRPLDFAVVTDHAELLGETHICKVPGSPGHDGVLCRLVRGWTRLGYGIVNGDVLSRWPPTRYGFCGENGELCIAAAEAPWAETQRAAEEAYDRTSACAFTSFVGFEWTGMPDAYNTHRNVVFRSEVVPERPINYIETSTSEGLWGELEQRCTRAGTGCDALAIPHNSNVSSGRLFTVETTEGRPMDAEAARRRSRLEPLVEITQHKGDSECRAPAGPTADEYCAYETPPGATMMEMMSELGVNESEPLTFVREVLAEGVAQQARIGANPFKLGVIGSTDTHYGTPGMVEERTFIGHAAGPVSRLVEAQPMPDLPQLNPGGLAAVWAEENTREAIFDAMARRETFGTSGPRMVVRVFGGWGLPEDLCGRDDFVEQGDALGVPMGGDLPTAPPAGAPAFAIRAKRDTGVPEAPGAMLERVQIVKLWAEGGAPREAVFDVAVDAPPAPGVDLDTCTPRGAGADELCAVWRDPDFDPAVPAAWYVRVLEEPTCRWTQWLCVDHGVDCSSPSSVPDDFAHCCDDAVPRTVQERAWASPIWYVPDT